LNILFPVPYTAQEMVFMYFVNTRITLHTAYQHCEPITLYFVVMVSHYTESVLNRICVSESYAYCTIHTTVSDYETFFEKNVTFISSFREQVLCLSKCIIHNRFDLELRIPF
jgi:hypothetical protein